MLKQINKNRITLKKTQERVEKFLIVPDSIVFFFDEGRFGLQSTLTRTWTKRGKPAYVKVKQGFKNFYIYSSVSYHTGEDFTLFLPEVNTLMMNIYLENLSKAYSNKKILIIMDQAGWHKSNNLIVPGNIEIEFLPPYSPELNPVEKLWQWLRKESIHNRIFDSLEKLMDILQEEYFKLSKSKLLKLCACSYLSHNK